MTPGANPYGYRAGAAALITYGLLAVFAFASGNNGPQTGAELSATGDEAAAIVKRVTAQYADSARLKAIMLEAKRRESGNAIGTLGFLVENNIGLTLSTDLPPGAAVQVFTDRLVLNAFMTTSAQTSAMRMAVGYMQGQMADGQPYGLGESFGLDRAPLGNSGPGVLKISP